MTLIVLPITSRANTDPNLYSDVYSGLVAITSIVNGDLRNDNLAAAGTANIAVGKLAAGSAGQLIVCGAAGGPVYRTLSGDATVSAAGALTIANNAVTNAKLADGAVTGGKVTDNSIGSGKLNLTTATDVLALGATFDSTYTTICSITPAAGEWLVLATIRKSNVAQIQVRLIQGTTTVLESVGDETPDTLQQTFTAIFTSDGTALNLQVKRIGGGGGFILGAETKLIGIKIG